MRGYNLNYYVYRDDEQDMTSDEMFDLIVAITDLCESRGMHIGGTCAAVDEDGNVIREGAR